MGYFINLLVTMARSFEDLVDINMEKMQDYETDEYKMILLCPIHTIYLRMMNK